MLKNMVFGHCYRNDKGVSSLMALPLMLFLYTMVFLICIELVLAVWMQISLNTVARQIAIKAATFEEFPLENAAQRCQAAVDSTGTYFPGYPLRVKQDFRDAVFYCVLALYQSRP